MKKLEDTPKENIFNTPEDYFDKLPGVIQARVGIAGKGKTTLQPVFIFSLRYALPVVVLLAACIFWFNRAVQPADAYSILSTVRTQDLVAYLSESDITTEEVIESADFSTLEIHEIEAEIYRIDSMDGNLQKILDDID